MDDARHRSCLDVMAEQCTGRGVAGVVAAAAPLAAALGAEALRSGGNAYDAAVTAALAETVLLPPKCGLAGDLVALRVTPEGDRPEALLAIGGAPEGLAAAVASRGLSLTGPDAVGVPGAPAGYAALAEHATRPLTQLVAPAVKLAAEGFVWSRICTVLASESTDLVQRWNPGGTPYFPDGRPLESGTVVRLPGLARLLEAFGRDGAELFAGPAGEAVVETVRRHGGVLTRDDLATFGAAEWARPVTTKIGPGTVWATPAPTHGASLVEAVRDARPGDSPTVVWQRVLAAVAARRRTLADTRAGTSMVSAADADGHAVVVVHSNSFPRFGSGLVVPEYDLILANRAGRGFTAEPGHPNAPSAGARPATTLHAWAWGAAGRAEILGGTPGGANQMPWNAQALQQLLDGERDPGALVVAPRWEWRPATGDPVNGTGDGVRVEEGVPDPDALVAVADGVEEVPLWTLRSAQQAIVRPRAGTACVAAVDPRTGGAVVPA